jgi:muconolactone D-isomerase
LCRVTGRFEVYNVFDVDSNNQLHQMLADLPLFPYMDVPWSPSVMHPSSLAAAGEREV